MEKSKAPLALMEQLAMVLVFALAAAICLRAFVYAGLGSKAIDMKNEGLSAATTVAEAVKAEDAGMLARFGLTFEPGKDMRRAPLMDGRTFEELGLHAAVSYKPGTEYVWEAEVSITDVKGGEVVSVTVSGQKGVQHGTE